MRQHLGCLFKLFSTTNTLFAFTFVVFVIHAFCIIKDEHHLSSESRLATVKDAYAALNKKKHDVIHIAKKISLISFNTSELLTYSDNEDIAFVIVNDLKALSAEVILRNKDADSATEALGYINSHIKEHVSKNEFIYSDSSGDFFMVAKEESRHGEGQYIYVFSYVELPKNTVLVSEMEAKDDSLGVPFTLNIYTSLSHYPAFITYKSKPITAILLESKILFVNPLLIIAVWVIYARHLKIHYPNQLLTHIKRIISGECSSHKLPHNLIEHKTALDGIEKTVQDTIFAEKQLSHEALSALKESCYIAIITDEFGIIKHTFSKHNEKNFTAFMFNGKHFHDALTDYGFLQSQANKDEYTKEDGEYIYSAKRNKSSYNTIITKNKKKHSSTMSSEVYDELTSVYNRYNFTDVVEQYLLTTPEKAYLVLIDINNFKLINDSVGFEIGDSVLMELSSIVRQHTSEQDVVGRLSGDEFVVLFKNKTLQEIESKVADIYGAISNYKLTHYDTKLSISVSIGIVSVCNNSKNLSITMALQAADYAAMTAKKNGFTYQMYDPNNDDIIFFQEAPIWIERIKSAIEHKNFEIFAQEIRPINPSSDKKHAEVLIRMKNEKGGYYLPYEFFGFAEKFNLMLDIDDWMISETFKLHRNTGQSTSLSINMSAESVNSSLFIAKIIQYARQYKINPETITLEVTETMAIEDMNGALKNINTLKAFGFKVALDDFGSGFSTLLYLQNIEADFLKIDGIFVKNIKNSTRDQAIVENVVRVAHDLNMKCIAEFVEDEETISILRKCGVDYLQGYIIHKPEPCSRWISDASKVNKQ